jgi:hypothetical protein
MHVHNEPSSKPTHGEHCLYLLAEAERIITRTSMDWSAAEVAAVSDRLAQIAEMLMAAGLRH